MKKYIKYIAGLAAVTTVFALALTATAAKPATAPGQNKLLCFSGTQDTEDGLTGDVIYNGTCTLQGNGARGPATLNNVDGDEDPYNNYSGVYVENSTMYGTALGDISQLSFNYTGEATAGSPRISIPLDLDGNGSTDAWAFAAAYYCNDGAGVVDVIHDATCTIYVGETSYENWAALVAAYPDAVIANDNYVFIVADDPGVWTVGAVKFGSVK